MIKEAIGKTRCDHQKVYPKKVLLGKETITNSKLITGNFNNFFTEIEPKFASEIEKTAKTLTFTSKKLTFYNLNILWVF